MKVQKNRNPTIKKSFGPDARQIRYYFYLLTFQLNKSTLDNLKIFQPLRTSLLKVLQILEDYSQNTYYYPLKLAECRNKNKSNKFHSSVCRPECVQRFEIFIKVMRGDFCCY